MKRYNFSRDEQKRRIVHRFADWIQKEGGEVWATSYRIANGLDLAPSSHLRRILQEMCFEGMLISRAVNRPGRWQAVEYTLKPGTYTPPPKRTIRLNGRGISEHQMVLF